jgi:polar amino acid transport system permease protein
VSYTFQFGVVIDNFGALLAGARLTVELTAAAVAIGLVIGIAGAFAKTSRARPVRWIVDLYVEAIRNTPFLVQLLFVFLGLPSLGLRLDANPAALLAMSINVGAYAIEIVRAGIEAVPRGQIEAGTALGLSRLQIFRHVVLLPALATVYPALAGQFIFMLLASSIVSQISAGDLTYAANILQSATYRSFEIYSAVLVIYLALALLFRAAFGLIHHHCFRFLDGAARLAGRAA